jgi:hypothetical protein
LRLHEAGRDQGHGPQRVLHLSRQPCASDALLARTNLAGFKYILTAEIAGHDAERALKHLRWFDIRVEARHAPQFAVGPRVACSVPLPADGIQLMPAANLTASGT